MIRIHQISVSIFEKDQEKAVLEKAAQLLHIPTDGFRKLKIMKRSVDARDKNDIRFSYTVDVKLRDTFTGPNAETERQYLAKCRNRNLSQISMIPVSIPDISEKASGKRPVIIGSGPCGLFAALTFAASGLRPIVIERGEKAEDRKKKCDLFFRTGKLYADSNIQFGEGGAGLFSDGKLNTSIKGNENYIRFVLETFVEFGADPDILTDAKPHLGTDVLEKVIVNMRRFIEEHGGTYYFSTKLTGFRELDDGNLRLELDGEVSELETDAVLLCCGHSAVDIFTLLKQKGIRLSQKPFAMGVRVQHPQRMIDEALYGKENLEEKEAILGPASYRLTHSCANGRSVFSFCMCPGGYVINSSSEPGMLTVNGMSYHDRDSSMANAAIIVNVSTEDFPSDDVLSGLVLQKDLERKAFSLCEGLIPYETFSEFESGTASPLGNSRFTPMFCGMAAPGDVRSVLPAYISDAVIEGMKAFGIQIHGFDDPDALICGIEARTSSPVRILRSETCETSQKGLYAAGEGAGYAGGITSAAVDGIKAAVHILTKYNEEVENV